MAADGLCAAISECKNECVHSPSIFVLFTRVLSFAGAHHLLNHLQLQVVTQVWIEWQQMVLWVDISGLLMDARTGLTYFPMYSSNDSFARAESLPATIICFMACADLSIAV